MECKDQLGYTISLDKTPRRIVCLVPSLTELLVDLDLEENIVGVTKFCVHPSYIRKTKTIIGGTKTLKIDKLKQVKPDFILCNKEENTKDMVATCKEIAPTYVSDINSIEDTITLIKALATIFKCTKESTFLQDRLTTFINNFTALPSTKKVVYFIWKDPWMVAGANTFINHLLELNGFSNVYANTSRYPEIDLQSLQKVKSIDYFFLSSEPYPFKEKHLSFLKTEFPNTKMLLVDGEFFSWYGSRLLKAFDYFKKLQTQL